MQAASAAAHAEESALLAAKKAAEANTSAARAAAVSAAQSYNLVSLHPPFACRFWAPSVLFQLTGGQGFSLRFVTERQSDNQAPIIPSAVCLCEVNTRQCMVVVCGSVLCLSNFASKRSHVSWHFVEEQCESLQIFSSRSSRNEHCGRSNAQARESALAAAHAEAAAASNALKTVETGINYYAARKEYIKLKDIAEASDVAGKVHRTQISAEHFVLTMLHFSSLHKHACPALDAACNTPAMHPQFCSPQLLEERQSRHKIHPAAKCRSPDRNSSTVFELPSCLS